MIQRLGFIPLAKRAALPTLCGAVMLYFGAHALFGASGYFALDGIRREHATLLEKQHQLQAQRNLLQRNIALLDPRGANPDFADELVRRHLGVVRPDELIVPLDPPAPR